MEFEIFVQGEGLREAAVLSVSPSMTVAEVASRAQELGFPGSGEEAIILLEDADAPLLHQHRLEEAGIRRDHCLHVNRCHRVLVAVNFNGSIERTFPASSTLRSVLKWAVGPQGFNLPAQDAAEQVLAFGDPATIVSEDQHVGSFTASGVCSAAFEMGPAARFQG